MLSVLGARFNQNKSPWCKVCLHLSLKRTVNVILCFSSLLDHGAGVYAALFIVLCFALEQRFPKFWMTLRFDKSSLMTSRS